MTQHFTDRSDTARLLADSLRDLERELYQAKSVAIDMESQRDSAISRARMYEYATWMLGAVVLALCVVMAGFM